MEGVTDAGVLGRAPRGSGRGALWPSQVQECCDPGPGGRRQALPLWPGGWECSVRQQGRLRRALSQPLQELLSLITWSRGALVAATCGSCPSRPSKRAYSRQSTGFRKFNRVIQPCPSRRWAHPKPPAPGPRSGGYSKTRGQLPLSFHSTNGAEYFGSKLSSAVAQLCDPGRVTIPLWSLFHHL